MSRGVSDNGNVSLQYSGMSAVYYISFHALGASFDKSINNEECVFDDEDDGHSSSSARNYRGIAPSWHSLCHSILTVCKERLRFAGGGFLFMSTIY